MQNIKIFDENSVKDFEKVHWQSPANIAFIKYWGKKGFQLPSNASLSMTLQNSYSDTTIFYKEKVNENPVLNFYFENKRNEQFEQKIQKFIENIKQYFSFLENYDLVLNSSNTFPHSAGIASSAAAMSSIALCFTSIENTLNHSFNDSNEFYRNASFISRIGSGSACRSVYGDFTVWGHHQEIINSNDEFAVELSGISKDFSELKDSILIVSSEKKKVSSTLGHSLMNNHPFANQRFEQANNNLTEIYDSMKTGDFEKFINILEAEALSLHGLMMTSNPGYILMEPNSLILINKIREIRQIENIPFGFTLDAGPNIHLIYPMNCEKEVKEIIKNELLKYCENNRIINDYSGSGPMQIYGD